MGVNDFLKRVNSKVTAWNSSMHRYKRVLIATTAVSRAVSTERIYIEGTLRFATTSWEREELLMRKGPAYRRSFEKAFAESGAALAAAGYEPHRPLELGADYAKPDFAPKVGADDHDIATDIRARIDQLQEERVATISETRHQLKSKPGLGDLFRKEMEDRGLGVLWREEFADTV